MYLKRDLCVIKNLEFLKYYCIKLNFFRYWTQNLNIFCARKKPSDMFFLKSLITLLALAQFSFETKAKTNSKENNNLITEETLTLDEYYDSIKMKKEKENKKIYLKDLLENQKNVTKSEFASNEYFENNSETHIDFPKEICNVKIVEISRKINKCGRIKMNTTGCEGICKSSSQFAESLNYQKVFCFACKAYEFDYVKHKVICADGNPAILMIKSVKSCNCFKNMEKVVQINLISRKKQTLGLH